MDENNYFLGISYFREIGPVRFKLLYGYFGSSKRIWESSFNDLLATGLNKNLVERFVRFRKDFDFEKVLIGLSKREIKFLSLIDKEYPEILRQIPDPPIVLFVKGNFGGLEKAIGVVGTRKMTFYGESACKKIVSDLVGDGAVIVSGLARGIDTVAHWTTLKNGGMTIAVLGTGVDVIYPPENRDLYFKIIEKGSIVSEVPPGQVSEKGSFRLRNRIISGLAQGVVVIEGAKESGSLITARYALDQGREVFAVPGPITSVMSEGPAYLISQGAKLITSGKDLLNPIMM